MLFLLSAVLQLVIVGVLIYAVARIHKVVKKHGLSQRTNYSMMLIYILELGYGLYVLSVFVWTGIFYFSNKIEYTNVGNWDDDKKKE